MWRQGWINPLASPGAKNLLWAPVEHPVFLKLVKNVAIKATDCRESWITTCDHSCSCTAKFTTFSGYTALSISVYINNLINLITTN